MNVTIHVIFWFDPLLNTVKELNTTNSYATAAQVTKSKRWSMSDQNICVIRNHVPLFQNLFSSLQVECPSTKFRLPRSSYEIDNYVENTGRKLFQCIHWQLAFKYFAVQVVFILFCPVLVLTEICVSVLHFLFRQIWLKSAKCKLSAKLTDVT